MSGPRPTTSRRRSLSTTAVRNSAYSLIELGNRFFPGKPQGRCQSHRIYQLHLCELLTEISGKTHVSSEELRLEHIKCVVFTWGHLLASVYAPSENQANEAREDGRASSCWVLTCPPLSTFSSTNPGL